MSAPADEQQFVGGIALKANLKFGEYFSVANAELSVLPRDSAPPILAGQFGPTTATLPGGIGFNNVAVEFSSAAPSLAARGQIASINLGPVFQLLPLSGSSQLNAKLEIKNNAAGVPQSSLSIDPARLNLGTSFEP